MEKEAIEVSTRPTIMAIFTSLFFIDTMGKSLSLKYLNRIQEAIRINHVQKLELSPNT